jgi:TolB-like protein/DNA-binding winged helix-turn-helix (wHTH) protein
MPMVAKVKKKYRLEEFELDVDKRQLKRDGENVHLASRPFQVLSYLIENRERLVSREELLDKFWDGQDVYDVNLTKCVGAIRKALNEQTENPRFIETRWAEGYRYIGKIEESLTAFEPASKSEKADSELVEAKEENSSKPNVTTQSAGFPTDTEGTESRQTALAFQINRLRLLASRPLLIGMLSLSVITLIAAVLYRYRASSENKSAPIRSIAVLPLKNLTGDAGQDYLTDGITESLITKLSKIEGLKVISRSSVFRFKGKDVEPEEVGRLLGVASVLEGSARRNNDSVQVTVRLVSVVDGSVLWAGESYERSIGDIFSLQDEIARNIVTGLRVKLSVPTEQRMAQHYTNNVEAYHLYLKGRYFWNKRTVENLNKSIAFYEQAISKDPAYALAYTGLADCYQLLAEYEAATPKEAFTKARAAAIKALQIDDQLAEAHTSLAYTLAFYDWDWTNAEKEFKRAIELNPNYPTAHQWYAEFLVALGRFDEARAEYERALQLDPTSLIILADIASYFFMVRDFDQSIAQSRKVIEMDPNFAYGYIFLMVSYGQKGMKQEMAEAYVKSVELFGETREAKELKETLSKSGVRAMWLKRLEQVDAPAKRESFSAQWRSLIYTWLDDKNKALDWLEKSFERRDRWVINIKYSPECDSVRDEPRFQDLVRRMGF